MRSPFLFGFRNAGGRMAIVKRGKKAKAKKPEPEKKTGADKKPSVPRTKAKLVEKAIKNVALKVLGTELKASVGDLVRLLELNKEIEREMPVDVQVTWVEDKAAVEK